jgi:ethanolaminephosphotransferase
MGFSSSVLDTINHGESPFSSRNIDVKHEKPLDETLDNVWFKEPAHSGVLTKDGVENIAEHKYVSGSSTYLDDFCNPYWTRLTELLPMWLAPNMVSTYGLLHLFVAYMITWYHTERLDMWIPSWIIFFNGVATIAYYTLDCMDGKQARRTGSSSPLGQLFDHGVDCLGNLQSISAASAYLMMGGSNWYFVTQACLQFSFWMAQWEEYYTGVLPHACGKWIGVTEVSRVLCCYYSQCCCHLSFILYAFIPAIMSDQLRYGRGFHD